MKSILHINVKIIRLAYLVLLLSLNSSFSQSPQTYFEMNSNTIAIEAEKAFGYGGWIIENSSQASNGQALVFPQSDTVMVQSTADTYIDRNNPYSNFGNDQHLYVKGKGGKKRGFFITPWWNGRYEAFEKAAFLKFNIATLQQPIVEAKLFLFCESAGIGGGIYSLDPMIDNLDWSETEATWNNKPSSHYDGNTFQDFLDYVVPSGQYISFDVTESLYGKQNGICGFGVVMQQDQPATWSSREGAHPPYLWIRTKKQGFQITGNCYYYANNNPIPDISVAASGDVTDSKNSNSLGNYLFDDVHSGASCTITPGKEAGTDVGSYDITTYDAALTAQRSIGLRTLNSDQEIAANVSEDSQITTYDAALIARYAVGLPPLADSHVAEWVFSPASRSYANLSTDQMNQNFKGILLGNVHGGWQAQSLAAGMRLAKTLNLRNYVVTSRELFDFSVPIPKRTDIISFDIEVAFDSTKLQFIKLEKGNLDQDVNLLYHEHHGTIRAGGYNVRPFTVAGKLLKIKFKLLANHSENLVVNVKRLLLNNDIEYRGKAIVYFENHDPMPSIYRLYQNYPNPFTPLSPTAKTMGIEFDLPCEAHVKVEIFNTLGQKIRRIVDGNENAGRHKVYWDGRNESGQLVGSGIYIYQLQSPKFTARKRMILLR